MPDTNNVPGQEPAEGSRETIERELNKNPENDNGSGSIRKPDMPSDGPRGGELNTKGYKPAV
ncbi:MAG: hypothetical protein JO056_04045 [Alphaproteobacteria bacterium]|nr:hypothetical protein [Alphaproteobacteria bacterium]